MYVGMCVDLYFGGLHVDSCMGLYGSENSHINPKIIFYT